MRTLYVGPTHLYGTRRHGTLTLPVRPTPDTPPARLSFGYLSQGPGEKGGHHPTPDLLVYPAPSTPRLIDLPLLLSSPLFAVVGTRDASRSREWEWDGMAWPADGQEMATGQGGERRRPNPMRRRGGWRAASAGSTPHRAAHARQKNRDLSCDARPADGEGAHRPQGITAPTTWSDGPEADLRPASPHGARRNGDELAGNHTTCTRSAPGGRRGKRKRRKKKKGENRGTGTTTTGRPIGASWCEDSPISFLSPPVNPSHGHGLLLLWKVRSFALRVHLADAWPPPSWREAVLHRASRPQFLIFSPLVWLASCVL
ncbi:hypothetical protein JHW43_000664 [Diplocarpon mali]|nr:hypothetical protein JHW43_000664 [Diplocarpon mali]